MNRTNPRSVHGNASSRTRIMSSERVQRTLRRLAYEIVEHNRGAERLSVFGIQTSGVPLAEALSREINRIEGANLTARPGRATPYRDDRDAESACWARTAGGRYGPRRHSSSMMCCLPAERPGPPSMRSFNSAGRAPFNSLCSSTGGTASIRSNRITSVGSFKRSTASKCRRHRRRLRRVRRRLSARRYSCCSVRSRTVSVAVVSRCTNRRISTPSRTSVPGARLCDCTRTWLRSASCVVSTTTERRLLV